MFLFCQYIFQNIFYFLILKNLYEEKNYFYNIHHSFIKQFIFFIQKVNFNFISINEDTEYSICIKDEYRDIIKGKITLPSKYDNKFITSVGNDTLSKGGFEDCDQITHVYFLNDN